MGERLIVQFAKENLDRTYVTGEFPSTPLPFSPSPTFEDMEHNYNLQLDSKKRQTPPLPSKKRKADEEIHHNELPPKRLVSKRKVPAMRTFHYTVSQDCSKSDGKPQRSRFMALERR